MTPPLAVRVRILTLAMLGLIRFWSFVVKKMGKKSKILEKKWKYSTQLIKWYSKMWFGIKYVKIWLQVI